jgi:hypothetical protein
MPCEPADPNEPNFLAVHNIDRIPALAHWLTHPGVVVMHFLSTFAYFLMQYPSSDPSVGAKNQPPGLKQIEVPFERRE